MDAGDPVVGLESAEQFAAENCARGAGDGDGQMHGFQVEFPSRDSAAIQGWSRQTSGRSRFERVWSSSRPVSSPAERSVCHRRGFHRWRVTGGPGPEELLVKTSLLLGEVTAKFRGMGRGVVEPPRGVLPQLLVKGDEMARVGGLAAGHRGRQHLAEVFAGDPDVDLVGGVADHRAGPPGLLKFCLPFQSPFMNERLLSGSGAVAGRCCPRDVAGRAHRAAQTSRKQMDTFHRPLLLQPTIAGPGISMTAASAGHSPRTRVKMASTLASWRV